MKRGFVNGIRAVLALALAFGVPAFAISCQSLANIEDRELGQCTELCDTVMANCKGDDQVYETHAKCMGVCKLLNPGNPDDPEPQGQDTIACRLSEARFAANEGSENRNTHCRSAGPEGINCGGSCENYCTLYERACNQIQCGSHENCVAKCAGLRNEKTFSLVDNYEGNSLQCRFVHLSNATLAPSPHCGHGQLQTPTLHCDDLPKPGQGEGGGTGSGSGVIDEPLCSDYCRVNRVACAGADAQYESDKQCLALCEYFVQGTIADKTENTRGCRIYHSYNSLCDAPHHCAHSGPGGEGHCGTTKEDKCIAYCHLAKGVCPSAYASATDGFGDEDETCAAECKKLPDAEFTDAIDAGTRYNVNYAATPGTLACRFLALSRAAVDAELCGTFSAFGKGDCAEE
jgi:hypothetical protein